MSDLIVPSRRGFLTGLGALLVTAPAIVRAASIMPVKQMLILGAGDRMPYLVDPMTAFPPVYFKNRMWWVNSDDPQTVHWSATGMGYK